VIAPPRIGLCMIVKNEAPVIARCLDSVRPLVGHWLIVDTGSTDGTQDLIRARMRGIPGELHERPWRDFAANRSEALALARGHADYSLVIDADDTAEADPGFRMPPLGADSYTLAIADVGTEYRRPQLVRNALPWRYEGVLHEYLVCEQAMTAEHLPGLRIRRRHDGARRRDPQTYRRDADLLERALATETNPFLIARYRFYLAQSFRDCGERENALQNYLERARLGFWQEEVFVSLLNAARLMEALGQPVAEVIAVYLRAADAAPERAEALHGAARFCRLRERYDEGYRVAKRGLALTPPPEGLFVERWIYEYGLRDEFAVNAYWAGHARESLGACLDIFADGKAPADQQARMFGNARSAFALLDQRAALGPGARPASLADSHALAPPRILHGRIGEPPKILLAILAKQKQPALPLYLQCLEALDYPKSRIVLYVRTNNNTDATERILRDWIERVAPSYAACEFDAADIAERVEEFGVHDWNPLRFKAIGAIRDASLRKTVEHGCDFYFTADVDNFLRPCTLPELVAPRLPIVAPFLRAIEPTALYSNYHADIDENGYYRSCLQYDWLLRRDVRGLIEVPVVHTTYLVRADVIPRLTFDDGSGRYEYVIFCDSARRAGVPQYLDNRQIYGYITFEEGSEVGRRMFGTDCKGQVERARALLADELAQSASG